MQSEENHTPKQCLEATGRYFTHVTSRDVPWEILNHGGLSPERGLPKEAAFLCFGHSHTLNEKTSPKNTKVG